MDPESSVSINSAVEKAVISKYDPSIKDLIPKMNTVGIMQLAKL